MDFLCLTSAGHDFSLQVTCGWDNIDRLEETLSGEICKHLIEEMVCEVDDLKCTHEEADTRMLLHALHCGTTGSRAVVIVSEDTDIFILCISFASHVPCPMYAKCGSKTRTQYFDVQKLVQMLGAEQCCALPGLHAFTGYDTVSAFAGRGKLKGLRLMSKSAQRRETLALLGSH